MAEPPTPPPPLIEERDIYEIDGRFWMALTAEEFIHWKEEAPHLIRFVAGKPCSEVTIRKKVKES
jgi:hypothetical protein